MSKIVKVSSGNYKISVQSGGIITLNTGSEIGQVVSTGDLIVSSNINIGKDVNIGGVILTSLVPVQGNTLSIGTTLAPWYDAWFTNLNTSIANISGNLDVGGDVEITGNLVVNGTTTTVNSTIVTINDPIFIVGGTTAPTMDDDKDKGIAFRWHTGSVAKLGFFGYDDSSGYFSFIPDATETNGVISGTLGDLQATNFRGDLIGNASTATKWLNARTITLAGDLSGSISIDGSADVTLTATIASDSVALGTDTTGNYVASVGVSGVGLSSSGTGEGAAVTVTSNATSLNTADTIVSRDGSGNFTASTITAALSGNASTATTLQTSRNISITGDASWTVSFNGSADVTGAITLATQAGLAGGTYNSVTVNSKGLVTSASNISYLTSEVDTLESVTTRGSSTSKSISITNSTNTSNLSTGALIVAGGVAISKDLIVDGTINGLLEGSVFASDSTLLVDGVNGRLYGPLTGDVVGSVFADDSTLLVDGANGRLYGPLTGDVVGNLQGNVTGDVVGNLQGNVTGNVVGNLQGDVVGSVFADDSTLLVDGANGRLHGPLTGDVVGSVFADDSTLLVDGANGRLYGPLTGDVVGSVFADDSTVLVDGPGGKVVGPVETTTVISNLLTLTPGAQPLTATEGMIAVADGITWDPNLNSTKALMIYLNGAWVKII